MSELKATTVYDAYWKAASNGDSSVSVYLKSEVDKTFEELKADYKEACGRLQTANLIKDEQLASTRHQKFKRCLAMAELCRAKRDEIIARTPTLILNHPTEYLTRWENRWLELAEKFKEAK